jgi:hypothetical protein
MSEETNAGSMAIGVVSQASFGLAMNASEEVIRKIRLLSEMTTEGDAIAVMDIVDDIITVFESKINKLRENA